MELVINSIWLYRRSTEVLNLPYFIDGIDELVNNEQQPPLL